LPLHSSETEGPVGKPKLLREIHCLCVREKFVKIHEKLSKNEKKN
jgi:hypothetical protein